MGGGCGRCGVMNKKVGVSKKGGGGVVLGGGGGPRFQ